MSEINNDDLSKVTGGAGAGSCNHRCGPHYTVLASRRLDGRTFEKRQCGNCSGIYYCYYTSDPTAWTPFTEAVFDGAMKV